MIQLGYGYDAEADGDYHEIELEDETRLDHTIIAGGTGTGKTSLMKSLLEQDAEEGQPFLLVDCEGPIADFAIRTLALHREPHEVIIIDPELEGRAVPLNPLAAGGPGHAVVEEIVAVFARMFASSWGPRSEDALRQISHLAREFGLSLADIPTLLVDKQLRNALAARSQQPAVRDYCLHLASLPERTAREWIEPVRNKASLFAQHPLLSPMLSADRCLDLREAMDDGRWVILRLRDGLLKDAGRTFASLVLSMTYMAALQRPEGAQPFYVYVDEVARYWNDALVEFTTRARKRSVGITMSFQALSMFPDPKSIETVMANAATLCAFRVGRRDAEVFAPEFYPPTGTAPKKQKSHWLWPPEKPEAYYSVQEELAHSANELTSQRRGEFYARVARSKGTTIYCGQAFHVDEPDIDAQDFVQQSLECHGAPIAELQEKAAARLQHLAPPSGHSPRVYKRPRVPGDDE